MTYQNRNEIIIFEQPKKTKKEERDWEEIDKIKNIIYYP